MNALNHSSFHLKGWHKVLLLLSGGLLLAGLAVGLFYGIENSSGRKAWEQYVRECDGWIPGIEAEDFAQPRARSRNYIGFKDLVPPPVEDSKNFANHPFWKEVFTGTASVSDDFLVKWIPSYQVKLGSFSGRNPDLEVQSHLLPGSASEAEEVLKRLEPGLKTHEEWRHYLKDHPLCRYPIDRGVDIPPDEYVLRIKELCSYAKTRCCALLMLNQGDKALQEIWFMMDLADTLSREPSLTDAGEKGNLYHGVLDLIWEGIVFDRWSQEQLAQLQERLARTDFWNDMRLGWMGSRAAVNQAFLNYVKGVGNGGRFDGSSLGKQERYAWLWPTGWDYRMLLEYNRMMDAFLEAMDPEEHCFKSPAWSETLKTLDYYLDPSSGARDARLIRLVAPSQEFHLVEIAYNQFLVQAAQVACALERYRLKNHRYPASLKALADILPEDELPRDWCNDKIPHLRLSEGGYILWSNGWNRLDEDGVNPARPQGILTPQLREKGDWVWEVKR